MHLQVREYVVDRLRKKRTIHFGTGQEVSQIQTHVKATVQGTDMTVASGPKDLDVVHMMSVLYKVVVARTRELQKLGIVKDAV